MITKTIEARAREDEEDFVWATASLGKARRSDKQKADALLQARW